VSVVVTAESGAPETYTFTVEVAKSSDSSLSSITVNGASVEADGSINLEPGTTSITVVALANDVDAFVEVSGDTSLRPGQNLVSIRVTAANSTHSDYSFTANVLEPANNADLALLEINGQDALANSTIYVTNNVTDAVVVAVTDSAAASYRVTSSTSLNVGENTISILVKAEDGTEKSYEVTVVRAEPLSGNSNLGSIKVNGEDCAESCIFDVVSGTTSVDVLATAEDLGASVEVFGNTGLKTGDNTVTVVVTAANSEKTSYLFTVRVALSDNANASSISVNGTALSLDDLNFTVSATESSVNVTATLEDADARYTVSGADSLEFEDNEIVVSVTAANNVAKRDYTIHVFRTPLSANTDLDSITVNGNSIEVDGTFEVDPGTTSVSVLAKAVDVESTVEVTGETDLSEGSNTVTVTISAPSGASQQYTFNVFVRSLSSDVSLATFTVDGADTEDGATISLDGTKNFVEVVARPANANAEVRVSGISGFTFGENEIQILVTAEDGSSKTYKVTVFYPDVTDATLSTFTVNGEDVVDGSSVDLAYGTTSVDVVAIPTYTIATFEITGNTNLVSGENTLTVTVTAADGET
ncbi:MAG: hypothetical protein EBT65_06625, partial [Actinobacteria bacterium]|nr:hypothetical protein [Actinomycetota bacterium]